MSSRPERNGVRVHIFLPTTSHGHSPRVGHDHSVTQVTKQQCGLGGRGGARQRDGGNDRPSEIAQGSVRQHHHAAAGAPAVMIDRAVAEHLEILRVARRLGIRIVEAVGHANALDRFLRGPIDRGRHSQAGNLKYRRRDIDHVVPLRAQAALVLDPRWPRDHETVSRSAVMRRDLLGPLEWRVHRMRPADRIMVVGFPGADVVSPAQYFLVVFGNAIKERHLVQ